MLVSDLKGCFTYQTTTDSVFHIRISHLGYFPLDTVVVAGLFHHFNLIPSVIGLREIVIKDRSFDKSTHIGSKAGVIKVNHQIANYLPGSGDNSVFTILRLMPGILASSEQSNGLIIWGSYEGHSQILFDGFTIWGLKSFNDEINAVNPLIAKEMIELARLTFAWSSIARRVRSETKVSGFKNSRYFPLEFAAPTLLPFANP